MSEVSFESTSFMSQAEFFAWVELQSRWDSNHYELLNGRVVMNPPAGYPHGEVEGAVAHLLREFATKRSAGKVFGSSQGFDLPSGDTVEPDGSFVSRERWAAMPAPEHGKFLKVVPDLVVEILSTATASHDRGEKKAIYERNGVREFWLIDARTRELMIFKLIDGRFDLGTVFHDGERARSSVLQGLEFAVADLLPS